MMDTQSVPKTIVHKEGHKNGVIHKKWYNHGRTSRTTSYGPAAYHKSGNFVVKNFLYLREAAKINHSKYFLQAITTRATALSKWSM